MERKTMYARVLEIKKTGHSKACNPHHYIVIEDENGNILDAQTKVNASCGYSIVNRGVGRYAGMWKIEYHNTRGGNIIIDFMR